MNKQRRKKIKEIKELIRGAEGILQKASSALSGVLDDEQDAIDAVPENLQSSDRFDEMEEAASSMEKAINLIDEAAEELSNI